MKRVFFGGLLVIALIALPMVALAFQDNTLECDAFMSEAANVRTSYYMGEGAAFTNSREYASAIDSFSCIIEQINTTYLPAFIARSNVYYAQRDYERALIDMQSILEIDQNNADAYNNIGVFSALLGDEESAIATFDQAISLNPSFVPALNNRAIMHLLESEFDEALTLFEQIVTESNVDDALALVREQDVTDEGLPDFTRAEVNALGMIGVTRSLQALATYDDYLAVARNRASRNIQNLAGQLESEFTYDLRLDDGSMFVLSPFTADRAITP